MGSLLILMTGLCFVFWVFVFDKLSLWQNLYQEVTATTFECVPRTSSEQFLSSYESQDTN